MTVKEFASKLGIRQMGDELPCYMEHEASRQNFLVMYGASDDLVEVAGKLSGEYDAFRPTTLYVTRTHVYTSEEGHPENAIPVQVEFSTHWEFQTEAPHARFRVNEEKELFGYGIVIDLNQLKD